MTMLKRDDWGQSCLVCLMFPCRCAILRGEEDSDMTEVGKARVALRKAREIHAACVNSGGSSEIRAKAFSEVEACKKALDAAIMKEYSDGLPKGDGPPAKSR